MMVGTNHILELLQLIPFFFAASKIHTLSHHMKRMRRYRTARPNQRRRHSAHIRNPRVTRKRRCATSRTKYIGGVSDKIINSRTSNTRKNPSFDLTKIDNHREQPFIPTNNNTQSSTPTNNYPSNSSSLSQNTSTDQKAETVDNATNEEILQKGDALSTLTINHPSNSSSLPQNTTTQKKEETVDNATNELILKNLNELSTQLKQNQPSPMPAETAAAQPSQPAKPDAAQPSPIPAETAAAQTSTFIPTDLDLQLLSSNKSNLPQATKAKPIDEEVVTYIETDAIKIVNNSINAAIDQWTKATEECNHPFEFTVTNVYDTEGDIQHRADATIPIPVKSDKQTDTNRNIKCHMRIINSNPEGRASPAPMFNNTYAYYMGNHVYSQWGYKLPCLLRPYAHFCIRQTNAYAANFTYRFPFFFMQNISNDSSLTNYHAVTNTAIFTEDADGTLYHHDNILNIPGMDELGYMAIAYQLLYAKYHIEQEKQASFDCFYIKLCPFHSNHDPILFEYAIDENSIVGFHSPYLVKVFDYDHIYYPNNPNQMIKSNQMPKTARPTLPRHKSVLWKLLTHLSDKQIIPPSSMVTQKMLSALGSKIIQFASVPNNHLVLPTHVIRVNPKQGYTIRSMVENKSVPISPNGSVDV